MGNLSFENKKAIADSIAEQIWREQSLTANRLSWNLTFQGFIITASSLLVVTDHVVPMRPSLQILLAVVGFVTSFFTYLSIRASARQRDYLKAEFNRLVKNEGDGFPYPRPFSEGANSIFGRMATSGPLLIFMAIWLLVSIVVFLGGLAPS